MIHYQGMYEKIVKTKKKVTEAKYIVYGFTITFPYWAYEAIISLGTRFTTTLGVKFLRMLSWTFNRFLSVKELAEELENKKVNNIDLLCFIIIHVIIIFINFILLYFYS